MKNKSGGMSTTAIVLIVIALAIASLAAYGILRVLQQPVITTTVPPTTPIITTPTVGIIPCPSDSTTDGQARYEDTLVATTTYLSQPTVYFVPKTSGLRRVTAGTLSTSAWSTAVDLTCKETEGGNKYRAVAVASQGVSHSVDEGVDFVTEGSSVKRDLKGKTYGDLQIRAEDNYAGGATFLNVTGAGPASNMNVTSYVAINDGANGVILKDCTGSTSLKVDADEYIDVILYTKTNSTKKQFGEDGLKTWLLVDADPASWDEPITGWQGGATLSNKGTSALQEEDQRKYSGIEYVYDVGSIGDRENKLTYYQDTAGGVDPGASADPVLEFCTEGRYNSNKQKDTILIGCWTDATTQAQVSTANRQKITIDVTA